MQYRGPEVYDDPEFSRQYHHKRQKVDNPNDALEKPVIEALLGSVAGKTILDLGCGDGKFGRQLLVEGAARYYGVDGSEQMVRLAEEQLSGQSAEVFRADLVHWPFPNLKFDTILSRLVLHYLEDLRPLFQKVYDHLLPDGEFIFSVEHPILTSCYESYNNVPGKRGNWIVDNYFEDGLRENIWLDKKVIKYHRTLETYFRVCQDTGFRVESIRESRPQRSNFQLEENFVRRKRIPLFLFFKLSR
ncbi:class I SAM-dependent DNA methyltransferase [Flavilitoribacter nigricans]|uniref:class I SAM-dependent DNA methyltransferase n=1 Tax=Flavilitoribacter nigricans TaxID=70997 RepID=UPI0014745387|nr:class I SAM-dependent methyltransferase [Flavilitoribacter nigricans]